MKVIFIGGHECQKRCTVKLQRELKAKGLDVTFLHPGFQRNWNKPLERVTRMLPHVQAVVVTTDVPTLLGKEIRRSARKAGVYCRTARARGKASIRSVIEEVAEKATARRTYNLVARDARSEARSVL